MRIKTNCGYKNRTGKRGNAVCTLQNNYPPRGELFTTPHVSVTTSSRAAREFNKEPYLRAR